MILVWLLAIVVIATVGVYVGFMCYASAKRMLVVWPNPLWDLKLTAEVMVAIGYPCDILYNATRGAWMFRHIDRWWFPRERMFSWRIQRLVNQYNALDGHDELLSPIGREEYALAINFARALDAGDPGHEKNVPPAA